MPETLQECQRKLQECRIELARAYRQKKELVEALKLSHSFMEHLFSKYPEIENDTERLLQKAEQAARAAIVRAESAP